MKRVKKQLLLIVVLLVPLACSREFEHDEDFMTDQATEIFEDNALLLSKIFKITGTDAYLWFDIHNEIANFSYPTLKVPYTRDGFGKTISLKLKGMLYSYNHEKQELTFLAIPSFLTKIEDEAIDFVFSLTKDESNAGETPTPPFPNPEKPSVNNRYILALKGIRFQRADKMIEVNTAAEYKDNVWRFQESTYKLTLIN